MSWKYEYNKDKLELDNIIKEYYNLKMQNYLFPQILQTSIFLSHSYKVIKKLYI